MNSALEPHPLETVPAGEAEQIEQVAAVQVELMQTRQDPHQRGQHPKQQALVHAVLEIAGDLPQALSVGLFAEPRSYNALIRFSTGATLNDADPNPHAMAFKVLDVDGAPEGTQDFIMLDYKQFFVRNVADYVEYCHAFKERPDAARFFASHVKEAENAQKLRTCIASHLERRYWTMLPLAMGGGAARFSAIPDPANASGFATATTTDGLREALERYLIGLGREARFELVAQAYSDPQSTPIEDAVSDWSTPFVQVGTLTIPPQDFASKEQFEFAEQLSFSPWHCLPEHRPLGGIQRCRRRVYEESTRLRHRLNGVAMREPTRADLRRLGPPLSTVEQLGVSR